MDYQPTTNNEDEFAKALNNLSGDSATPSNDFFADDNSGTEHLSKDGEDEGTDGGAKASWEPRSASDQFSDSVESQNFQGSSDTTTGSASAVEPAATAPAVETPSATPSPAAGGDDLNSLKTSVLTDLRPVIDNVDIVPDEKYNLLSTLFNANQDSTLIEPAYAAARQISDDTKRAEALLKIVHDIDSVN